MPLICPHCAAVFPVARNGLCPACSKPTETGLSTPRDHIPPKSKGWVLCISVGMTLGLMSWFFSGALNENGAVSFVALLSGLLVGGLLGMVVRTILFSRGYRWTGILGLISYLFSFGPVVFLAEWNVPHIAPMARTIYSPVVLLYKIPFLEKPLWAYEKFWTDLPRKLKN
jgi:hypothetical protein